MKKSILSLLAVAAMVSCTQNDMDLKGSDEQVEIKLKSTALSIDAAVSRAPFEGAISSSNKLEAKVLKASTTGDYSTPYEGIIEFEDVSTATATYGFADPQYYPVNPSTSVFLVGLYPQTANWALSASGNGLYDVTVKGNEDLMVAKQVETKKLDVVVTAPTVPNYPVLDFKHLLTKLEVKVVAKDAASQTAWGKIKQITLTQAGGNGIKNTITANLVSGAPLINSTTVADFPFYVVDASATPKYTETKLNATDYVAGITLPVAADPTDPAASAENVAYSLIAPFEATSTKNVVLKVISEESDVNGYLAKVDLNLVAGNDGSVAAMQGKSITITLTFVGTQILAKAKVADWVDGGSADGTIE